MSGKTSAGPAASNAGRGLFENERLFRLLVEGVVDYAIFMLSPEGHVINWNAGAERIKGYSAHEIIGQHFGKFYTEGDREAGKPMHSLETAREFGRFSAEGWRVRKDGTKFFASVVIDAIYENGELIGFAKITRDITERRNAQEQLDKMQKQLAESQKLDALGQLTGGVAHDFNNLLMIVSGHIATLRRMPKVTPRAARAIEAIEAATRRGSALTRQLLTFSRRQRVNPEPLNLQTRVGAIRDLLSTGLGKRVELAIDIAPDVWPVVVDNSEFEIALVNLVINARDAMPGEGLVTILARNAHLGEGELVPAGEYVAISVEDNGVGIAADVLPKVFDPFFTTKPVGKGTGLGLSQVHGFAHQAGGTVKIASTLGRGTTITIYLPRETEIIEADWFPFIEEPSLGTVLLVEDNPDVASASTSILEELGYSVRWAANSDAALEEIEKNGIQLVLSDIVMPGKMDGLGLAHVLREKYPELPVLLTTGYSDAALHVQSNFKILRKPYAPDELNEAIKSMRSP